MNKCVVYYLFRKYNIFFDKVICKISFIDIILINWFVYRINKNYSFIKNEIKKKF